MWITVVSAALFLALAEGSADSERLRFLAEFVQGKYLLIGKGPDSDRSYSGEVELFSESGKLRIRRLIADTTVVGEVGIEEALHGEAIVLRMRFTEQGIAYEDTCLMQSDLNNYARLSCYLYRQDGTTRKPGVEALFIQPLR